MSDSVGRIDLDLAINQEGFDKQLNGITNVAKKAGATLAAAFGVKKLVEFGSKSLKLGSALEEVQNVVDVVFPNMTAHVDKFAQSAAASFGLSETMAKKFTGTFGSMARAFGFSEGAAYEMSTTLAGLAGDVASFYDIEQSLAYTKLKSVFSGETETLKDLGIVMTQTALDAYAMANGYGKVTKNMSEAEKVFLRSAFIQDKLAFANGDYARTSDSWANQVRIMKLQMESFMATVGQGFINLFSPVIKVINAVIGRLVVAADAFKAFTELVTGKKSGANQVGSIGEKAAGGLNDATGAAEGLSAATDKAGKSAKKAAKDMKSLMGFDKINKLDEKSDDSDKDKGKPGGGMDFGKLAEGDASVNKTGKSLSKLLAKAKELAKLFKKGFRIGFGDSQKKIESIKSHIKGIGRSLKDLFTDPKVASAVDGWAKSVAFNMGKVAGSATRVGLTVADNLLGGIDKCLEQNGDFIRDKLASIFNIQTEINDLVGDFAVAAADIFSVFSGDTAKQCTADIAGIFVNGATGLVELGKKIERDVTGVVVTPFVRNKDKIKAAIENTLEPIGTVLSTLNKAVKNTFDKIGQVYDERVKPMFDSFGQGISDIVGALLDGYNTHVAPVLQALADKFGEVWEGKVQPTIDNFVELFGKLADLIRRVWEETVQPFLEGIASELGPLVAPVIERIGSAFMDALGGVCEHVINPIVNALGKFADWCGTHQGTIVKIGQVVAGFFAAWKTVKLMSFIEQSGGVVEAFKNLSAPIASATKALAANAAQFVKNKVAKVADKAETVALNALYAKDFVVNMAKGTAALVKQAAQFAVSKAAKVADTIAQKAMTAATVVWNTTCKVATVVTKGLGIAINFLTSPIGLVILAIGALVIAAILICKNWDKIKAKAIEIWKKICDTFKNVGKWFKEKFKAAYESIKKVFSSIGSWFKEKYTAVTNVFKNVGKWFKDKFKAAYEGIKTIFSNIGGWFKDKYTAIVDVFKGIPGWFRKKFTDAWDSIKKVFNGVGGFFGGIWDTIKDKFTKIGTKVGEVIGKAFKSVINAVLSTAESVLNAPINAINKLLSFINKISPIEIKKINTFKLPRLAQGGYVKKNTPQLAMIGDNKHQGEVVAPENKLREMAMEAVRMAGGNSNNGEVISLLKELIALVRELDLNVELDGDKIKKNVVRRIRMDTKSRGMNPIIT